jgi:hypothetical protein
MRGMLILAATFCLALPLSADAAVRHRAALMCPINPPLARQVCLCELSGGDPHIWYFPPPPRVLCFARGLLP